MNYIPAKRVSERIADLIERHDGGNREVAALRLGIEPDHLSGLLAETGRASPWTRWPSWSEGTPCR